MNGNRMPALPLGSALGISLATGCGKTMEPAAGADACGYQIINFGAIFSRKHDEPIQTLPVVTVAGGVFDCAGVPIKVYEEFIAAEDKDSYWPANIKDKFKPPSSDAPGVRRAGVS